MTCNSCSGRMASRTVVLSQRSRGMPPTSRGGNEANKVTLVLYSETPLAGPQEVGINKLLQTHSETHDGAITRHHLGDSRAAYHCRTLPPGLPHLSLAHHKPSSAPDPHPSNPATRTQ